MNPEERDKCEEPEPAGIEIRVIGGGAPQGWIPVEDEEEVFRLEHKQLPQVTKSVEDVGPAGPEPERRRGKKYSLRNRHFTLAMAGGVGLLILLGVVVAVQSRNDGSPGEAAPFEGVGVDKEIDLTSLGQLSANTQSYLAKAQSKLKSYVAAEDVSDVIPVIRDRGRWLAVLKQRWKPLQMKQDKVDDLQLALAESGEKAWFSLNGHDDEGHELQLIFVPNGDEVELDWAASFGVGEVPFEGLDELPPAQDVAMRVMLEVDYYFTSEFPEKDFLCFKLTPRLGPDWVWGYAEVGSPVAARLTEMLRADSLILEQKDQISVILSVKKTADAGRRQLLIGELLAEDWIEWEAD